MKCPICGKELELKNKQIGTDENGDPVFNEYAICRDCRKQWNLDRQRAKKNAAKVAAAEKGDASKKNVPSKDSAAKTASAAVSGTTQKVASPAALAKDGGAPAKKTVKKRPVQSAHTEEPEEKRYSNIPPEKVRTKHETAARKSYGDMLATGAIGKPVKKKKIQPEDDKQGTSGSSPAQTDRKKAAKPVSKPAEPEFDDYDDGDDYYESTPRFRAMRVILGIISLLGFGYFLYMGFTTGFSSSTDSGVAGMTFAILALCLLVSALLYFITIKTNNVFAFLLPMLFYLGSAVFAFLKRGDDLQLFIAAVAAAVLAVISLILAITSRGGDDYDDYDDAFEDDYADEYDD